MTDNNKGMNPVAAAVVGAAAGLAVGATVAVLADEENRKVIGDKFNEVKDKVGDMASGVQDKVGQVVSQGEEKVKEAKKSIKAKL